MKTFQTILLICVSLIVFYCKEDEKPSFDESMVVGEWEAMSLDYSGTTSTTFLGFTIGSTYTGEMLESDMVVEFTKEPNQFLTTGSYTVKLTTTIEGVSETEEIELPNIFFPGTWKLEGGNKMIVTSAGADPQEATIEQLDATTMVISTTVTQTTEDSGFTITNETHAKYQLKKVQ